jgi:hypothetical protein
VTAQGSSFIGSALPSHGYRLLIATAVGLVCGSLALWTGYRLTDTASDFDQTWFAARALLHGDNPYMLIGPGLNFDWGWPFAYPLTAAVGAIPVAPAPVEWARSIFAACGAGMLSCGALRCGWRP